MHSKQNDQLGERYFIIKFAYMIKVLYQIRDLKEKKTFRTKKFRTDGKSNYGGRDYHFGVKSIFAVTKKNFYYLICELKLP